MWWYNQNFLTNKVSNKTGVKIKALFIMNLILLFTET